MDIFATIVEGEKFFAGNFEVRHINNEKTMNR